MIVNGANCTECPEPKLHVHTCCTRGDSDSDVEKEDREDPNNEDERKSRKRTADWEVDKEHNSLFPTLQRIEPCCEQFQSLVVTKLYSSASWPISSQICFPGPHGIKVVKPFWEPWVARSADVGSDTNSGSRLASNSSFRMHFEYQAWVKFGGICFTSHSTTTLTLIVILSDKEGHQFRLSIVKLTVEGYFLSCLW